MSKILWTALCIGLTVPGLVSVLTRRATANPISANVYSQSRSLTEHTPAISQSQSSGNAKSSSTELLSTDFSPDSLEQVTSVSQLSDVQPTDWAFQALQSLVERYGCIAGYPDGTFRGNRAATRYELAAALNACLDQISDKFATKEDLEKVKALQEEFKTELATLKGRVDGLEARTATLEAQQFSTTTKLHGEVIFSFGQAFGNERAVSANLPISAENFPGKIDSRPFLSDRVRLEFDTSFSGRDRLKIRLESLNTPEIKDATGTNFGRLQWDGAGNNNNFSLTILEYLFPIGDKTTVVVAAKDELYRLVEDQVEALSPLESDGNGALSKFGRFNPLFRLGGEYPAGASISHRFNNSVNLSLAYLGSPDSGNVSSGGLFGSAYAALAQLNVRPIESLTLGFTYLHSYAEDLRDESRSSFDFETSSKLAVNPFPSNDPNFQKASADSFGFEFAYRATSWLTLSGWAGYSRVARVNTGDTAGVLNWAGELVFPDLGKQGNLGALVVGMPPKVVSNSYNDPVSGGDVEPSSSLHLEALYRFQVTDNIAVTPGVIAILNPENNSANDPIFVGVVRTTFSF
jgi:hypothetical protein